MRYLMIAFCLMASVALSEEPFTVAEDGVKFNNNDIMRVLGKLYTKDNRPIVAMGKQRIIEISGARFLLSKSGRYALIIQVGNDVYIRINNSPLVKYDSNIDLDNLTAKDAMPDKVLVNEDNQVFTLISNVNGKLCADGNKPMFAVDKPRIIVHKRDTGDDARMLLFTDGRFAQIRKVSSTDYILFDRDGDGKREFIKYDPNVIMELDKQVQAVKLTTQPPQTTQVPQAPYVPQEEVPENKNVIGKAFIKTDPPGAELTANEKVIGKTPCLLNLHVGKHIITASLENYQNKEITVIIKDTNINKPEVFKLYQQMMQVDILYEKELPIFVDDKPYLDNGVQVKTPATIKLVPGKHIIKLREENMRTIFKEINTDDKTIDMNVESKIGYDKKAVEVNKEQTQPLKAYKGKFYTNIDDMGIFYLNAKKVYQTPDNKVATSQEMVLKDGDVVVINLVNTGGIRNCVFSFIQTNGAALIMESIKDISAIKLNELTIDKIKTAPMSSLIRINNFWNTNSSKNLNEVQYHAAYRGWGNNDESCWVAFIVGSN